MKANSTSGLAGLSAALSVDYAMGTLILVAFYENSILIAGDSREVRTLGPPKDTATKIYPAGRHAAAVLTGFASMRIGAQEISIPTIIQEVLTRATLSNGTLAQIAEALANAIVPAIAKYFGELKVPGENVVIEVSRDICTIGVVGPEHGGASGIEIHIFFNDTRPFVRGGQTTQIKGRIGSQIVFQMPPGTLTVQPFGVTPIWDLLMTKDDRRLARHYARPVIAKYRNQARTKSDTVYSRSEVYDLLRLGITITQDEWLNFLPPPVGVHTPIDMVEIDRQKGFRWVQSKAKR